MKKIILIALVLSGSCFAFAQKSDESQKQADLIGKGLIDALKENRYNAIEKFLVTESVVQRILMQKSEAVSLDSVKKTNVFIRSNFRNKLVEAINTCKKTGEDKDLLFQKAKLSDNGKKSGINFNLSVNYTGKAGKKEETRLRLVKYDDKFYVVSFDK